MTVLRECRTDLVIPCIVQHHLCMTLIMILDTALACMVLAKEHHLHCQVNIKTQIAEIDIKDGSDGYFGLLVVIMLLFNVILLLGKDDAIILYIGNEVYLNINIKFYLTD